MNHESGRSHRNRVQCTSLYQRLTLQIQREREKKTHSQVEQECQSKYLLVAMENMFLEHLCEDQSKKRGTHPHFYCVDGDLGTVRELARHEMDDARQCSQTLRQRVVHIAHRQLAGETAQDCVFGYWGFHKALVWFLATAKYMVDDVRVWLM